MEAITYDRTELQNFIIDKWSTAEECIRQTGTTRSTLWRAMSGTGLTQGSIEQLVDKLDIPREKIGVFFYTRKITKPTI